LIEVEGEVTGNALYTLDWLRDRVRWHLDPGLSTAAVLLAEGTGGRVLGHTIVRRETDENGNTFGLVSTTYVDPDARRANIGQRLLHAGEQWFRELSLPISATWTSAQNAKLIRLYQKNDYRIVETQTHETTGTAMLKLEKRL
jgi:GNAT superfamily N-acetyltransferase